MTNAPQPTKAELMETASKMWRGGHRIRDIAQKLGITETRISTWAYENRDLFPSRLRRAGAGKKTEADIIRGVAWRSGNGKTIKPKFPEKAPGFPGVTIRDRDACGCEFPLWGHHEDFDFDTSLYCGAPRVNGKSYCRFHCDLTSGSGTASERGAPEVLRKAARAGA